jgi:tetratricopeptide (TPR) repeat protein
MSEAKLESEVDAIYAFIDAGDLDAADERLQGAMAAFGQQEELLVIQSEITLEEEDFEGAVTAVEQALKLASDPEFVARLKSIQGYACYYLDQLDGARIAFNESVRSDSELLTALIGRAMVHEQMGFMNAAMLDLDRVTEADDQIGQPFAIRGSIHLRWGNMELAEGDLEHAVQMDPDDEESRLNLARIHALARSTSAALTALEGLADHGEDDDHVAPGLLLRSQVSLTLGSIDAGLEDAERVIEMLPEQPWGYLQAAACHISRGIDGGVAIELLKQAEGCVASERDLPDLYALRAAAYDILGKPEKAAELRESAEGVARLPAFVYGPLNPVGNIPINPNKPIDVRALMDELFGSAADAPDGYEGVLRQIIDQIPQLAKEHPGVGQIQVELPEAPGMIGGSRQLVVSLGNQQKSA